MKKIINGYLQEDLIKHDIDLIDVEIIKYFLQFSNSSKMRYKEIDGKLYFWLSYQKIMDDLPILRISTKRTIARRFDKLEEIGLMEKKMVNDGKGVLTFFRLTELHESWLHNIGRVNEVIVKKESKVEKTKDNTPYKEIIDYLNERAGQGFDFTTQSYRKLIKSHFDKGATLQDFKHIIDVRVGEVKGRTWEWRGKTIIGDNQLMPRKLFAVDTFDEYKNKKLAKGVNNAESYADRLKPRD